MLLLRGLLALGFAATTLIWTPGAASHLALLVAAYAIADGVVAIATMVTRGGHGWPHVLRLVLGLGLGVAVWVQPSVGLSALMVVLALWSITLGLLELLIGLRDELARAAMPWLPLAGAMSLLLGLALSLYSRVGAPVLASMVGVHATLWGSALLLTGIALIRGRHAARAR